MNSKYGIIRKGQIRKRSSLHVDNNTYREILDKVNIGRPTHIAVTYYIRAFTDRFDTVIFHSDADRSN